MKKILLLCFSLLLLFNAAYAADLAKLKIKIADSLDTKKYFLCIYNVGCLNIHAGAQGKNFVMYPMNMGNIKKFAITDVSNMKMHLQLSDPSCDVVVNKNQTLTITGRLVVQNNVPSINHLKCAVN